MDKVISSYPYIAFDELNYCVDHGVMYQRDMTVSVPYDNNYFEKYIRYENTDIAKKLNEGRTAITEKYCMSVLDVGIGSGEFIKASSIRAFGYDINPVAIRWLRENGLYKDPYANLSNVDGLTFWDSLEHIPNPGQLFSVVKPGQYVFISIPIFTDLSWVKRSKHYRPNEHYYYFTTKGLIRWLNDSGFEVVEMSDFETRAGREDILTFVFKKA